MKKARHYSGGCEHAWRQKPVSLGLKVSLSYWRQRELRVFSAARWVFKGEDSLHFFIGCARYLVKAFGERESHFVTGERTPMWS